MVKNTGIERRIDELGRVVIPAELRNTLKWEDKDSLEMYLEKDCVCIRKPNFEGRIDSVEIIRNLDELGRIVIPKELRDKLDITFKNTVEVFVRKDVVMIKKIESSCVFCNSSTNLKEYNCKFVCSECLEKLRKI